MAFQIMEPWVSNASQVSNPNMYMYPLIKVIIKHSYLHLLQQLSKLFESLLLLALWGGPRKKRTKRLALCEIIRGKYLPYHISLNPVIISFIIYWKAIMRIDLALRRSRIVPNVGKRLPVIWNSQVQRKVRGLLVCLLLEESAFFRRMFLVQPLEWL